MILACWCSGASTSARNDSQVCKVSTARPGPEPGSWKIRLGVAVAEENRFEGICSLPKPLSLRSSVLLPAPVCPITPMFTVSLCTRRCSVRTRTVQSLIRAEINAARSAPSLSIRARSVNTRASAESGDRAPAAALRSPASVTSPAHVSARCCQPLDKASTNSR